MAKQKIRFDVPTLWYGPSRESIWHSDARLRILWPDGLMTYVTACPFYIGYYTFTQSCFYSYGDSSKETIERMKRWDELTSRFPAIYCGPLFVDKKNAP